MAMRFLTAGESHGPCLMAIIEGMPAGIPLTPEDINRELARRQRGFGSGARMKIEQDTVSILSGVSQGVTTGAPIALRIDNLDYARWKDRAIPRMTIPRPGHVDLTAAQKYGYRDLRLGLERASARETAARVAVGGAARRLLAEFGIAVGSYVESIGEVAGDVPPLPLPDLWALAEANDVRCPDGAAAKRMQEAIEEAMRAKDTLGGIIVVAAVGVPPGLGSHVHWDRRLDARLAAALMSIQAIKGVEIGEAFANARLSGTQVHDDIFLENGRLVRHTNRAGGLEGGISTGEPIIARVAMKPLATTLTPHRSVDLAIGQPAPTTYERSDFCAVPRAAVVAEAMLAWVLADALVDKLGGDSLTEMRPRWAALTKGEWPLPGWEEPV